MAASALVFTLALSIAARQSARSESGADSSIAARSLACEHLAEPLGVEAARPRLSWKLDATDDTQRGAAQSGYRLLAASSAAHLAADEGDLWDSGRVDSRETVDVVWGGAPLASNTAAHWKVMVFDEAGHASAWSAPAHFSTGLLDAREWRGAWIGFDGPTRDRAAQDSFADARWIWFAGDEPGAAPAAARRFAVEFDVPPDAHIRSATWTLTADDQARAYVNSALVHSSNGTTDAWRQPASVPVATWLVPGVNRLVIEARNTSRGHAGVLARLVVEFEDGTSSSVATDANWRGALEDGTREAAARALGSHGDAPWGRLDEQGHFLPPVRLLRTEFNVAEKPVRATLFASALGLFEVEIDGTRVGDDWFAPGWTDYQTRVPYRTYDVTELVHAGRSALGVRLGDGWFAGYVGYGGQREHYGAQPRFLGQLHLQFADGSTAIIASNGTWRASTGGALESDFLMGETFDARREPRDWSRAGFNAAEWQSVDVGAEVAPRLEVHRGYPVSVVGEFEPVATWQTGPDTWIFDLGQNIAGVVRLTVNGEAGRRVVVRHAERLNSVPNVQADGSTQWVEDRTQLYTTNLRGARATDTYICRGNGVETWQPRFTFHGFQYVEVTGFGAAPRAGQVVGLALSSDTPFVGELETSEPALTKLLENIRWTQRMNFIDVPTDCPQRDERLGWTGDAQMYIETAIWNADVQAFYDKWLVDLVDAQRDDGQFPMVAPQIVAGDDGGPAWADAGVICPLALFDAYGDRALLERVYPAMQRFIDFCERRFGADGLPPANYHCFGDWVSIGASTPNDVIAAAYFAHSAELVARAAAVLGRADDAQRFRQLFERQKRVFRENFVDAAGRVRGESQCGYALALSFGLLDGEQTRRAGEHLVADIEAHGNHFTTGFVGTKDLLLALDAIGRTDVAYRLLLGRDYPSWRFSLDHGATSIWERWDGWTPERGFQDPGMNSFAHYAFGAVGQWMFETIGGLRSDAPGFSHLVLAPRPGGGLTHARARYDSVRGEIEVAWRIDGERLAVDVHVPPNVSATVVLPRRAGVELHESGEPIATAHGVSELTHTTNEWHVEVGSGRYHFTL